jgi:hypothetical protein
MGKISLIGQLDELRRGYMNYIKDKAAEMLGEDWPEYVLRDWVYKNTKNMSEFESIRSYKKLVQLFLEYFIERHGTGYWILDEITINIDSFNEDTKDYLIQRMDDSFKMNVEKDAERHEKQKELLLQRGVSKEPIIVIQHKDGLELLEGWHRTVQSLKLFGEYEQIAYIYIYIYIKK